MVKPSDCNIKNTIYAEKIAAAEKYIDSELLSKYSKYTPRVSIDMKDHQSVVYMIHDLYKEHWSIEFGTDQRGEQDCSIVYFTARK
jgi:hypothetical protein